jgi:hypothetical protein
VRTVLFGALGILFAILCAFFVYYTARLIYVNVFGPSLAGHRQTGMYIGAVAFPTAVFVFGWLSLRCFRLISRPTRLLSKQ